MPDINPNLLRASASPIMEAFSWVEQASPPANRPMLMLSQAAPALPPPLPIRERLASAMLDDPSAHFYGAVLGRDELRAEIATQWSGRYGGQIEADQVAITAGCNQAYCIAIASACQPGDAVMLPFPWYFNHKMWLDMAGIACVPLPSGDDMLPDLAQARALMDARIKAIVLVTPNNPTGAEYPDDLLHGFVDLAQQNDALLIVDETYRDFHSMDGAPHTLFQRDDWDRSLAHLYSFSKAFRLTGHRTGAIVTGAERLLQAEKFLDTMTICPAQPGQIAALFGLQNLGDWVETERAEFRTRRQTLTRLFAEHLPDWTVHGAGAYFAWVTPPYGLSSTDMARRLVAQQSVLVLPGDMFMPDGHPTSALRIAFANADTDGITELVRRLSSFQP